MIDLTRASRVQLEERLFQRVDVTTAVVIRDLVAARSARLGKSALIAPAHAENTS
jgi:hypothetical protein